MILRRKKIQSSDLSPAQVREHRLVQDTDYFSKYLPKNMSWEELDDLIERTITTISIMQIMENSYYAPWVTREQVEHHLIKSDFDETIKYPVLISFRRLIMNQRVVTNGRKTGLPDVRPKSSSA